MYAEAKSLREELRTDDIIVRAFKKLERVNADAKMRAILEQRDKDERTRITELNAALKKGREEGREEGLAERRVEGRDEERGSVARNMLDMGLGISLISRATGLPVEVFEKMKPDMK